MERSGGVGLTGIGVELLGMAERRQWEWQKRLQLMILQVDQSMWGLWSSNQGRPRTTGDMGDEIT